MKNGLTSLRSWWSVHRDAYLVTIGIAAAVVFGLAISLGAERVASAGWQVFGTVIALPFVVALALILLCLVVLLPLLLLSLLLESDIDIGGDFVADLCARVITGYFGWFGRRRHPVFWGVVTGAFVATAALASYENLIVR
jgi:hypothetical protein